LLRKIQHFGVKALQKLCLYLRNICIFTLVPGILFSAMFNFLAIKLDKIRINPRKIANYTVNKLYNKAGVPAVLNYLGKIPGSKPIRCPVCKGRSHPNNPWGKKCLVCKNRGNLI